MPVGFCSEITSLDGTPSSLEKQEVMRGWTEIRIELKGTSGDDLNSLTAVRQQDQLYSLHQDWKMRIPPLYTFRLANGDKGVNRSEHLTILLRRFSNDKYRVLSLLLHTG